MKISFYRALEYYRELENRKSEIMDKFIKYNLDNKTLQELVNRLKEIEKKISEIHDPGVDSGFIIKKSY